MKEGWERKKIKEVADVIGGSTPKTNVEEYWGGNNYWVTPAELDGSKYIEKTVRCITSNAVDKTNLTLMPSGTVLLSSRAPIGKVCITKAPMYCNQGFKNLICKELLYNEFAYYFLKHNVDYLQSLGTGATFKEISKKVVENVTIPVPPLSEQQHIVEELDLLSSIIEKKKAQLIELDNLAQSLFYEMFGDPITNEKGWEVRKLADISKEKLSYGSGASAIPYDGILRYIRITDINDSGELNENVVSPNSFEEKYLLNNGDILFARSGATVGKTYCHKEKYGKCIYAGYLIRLIPNTDIVLPSYVFGYTKTQYYMEFVKCAQNAVAQPNINAKQYGNLDICIPPLDMQNQFASKIEAIEHQKELIKQSIKEVETLFNSRLDYYFN